MLGEAKWGQTMGLGELQRLVEIRDLLAEREDLALGGTVLACFSAAGFTRELRRAERDGKALLVDLDRLYGGR